MEAEALDPRIATIIAVTFVILIFALPIASVLNFYLFK